MSVEQQELPGSKLQCAVPQEDWGMDFASEDIGTLARDTTVRERGRNKD
jgi:hypothetical protein